MFGSPWIVDYLLEFKPYEICNVPRTLRFVKDFDGEKEISDNIFTVADLRSSIKSFFKNPPKEQAISTLNNSDVNNWLISLKRYCFMYSNSNHATSSNNEILLVIIDFVIQPFENKFLENDLISCMEIVNVLQRMNNHIRVNPNLVLEKESYPDFSSIEMLDFNAITKRSKKVVSNPKSWMYKPTIYQLRSNNLFLDILHKDIDWSDSEEVKENYKSAKSKTMLLEDSEDIESMTHETLDEVSSINEVSLPISTDSDLNDENIDAFEPLYPNVKLTHIKKRVDFGIQTKFKRLPKSQMTGCQALIFEDVCDGETLRSKLNEFENERRHPYESEILTVEKSLLPSDPPETTNDDSTLNETLKKSSARIETSEKKCEQEPEKARSYVARKQFRFTKLINKTKLISDEDAISTESQLSSRASESNSIEPGEFMDNDCSTAFTRCIVTSATQASDSNINSSSNSMNSDTKDNVESNNVDNYANNMAEDISCKVELLSPRSQTLRKICELMNYANVDTQHAMAVSSEIHVTENVMRELKVGLIDVVKSEKYVSMVSDDLFTTSELMDFSDDDFTESIKGMTLFLPMVTNQFVYDPKNSRCKSKTNKCDPAPNQDLSSNLCQDVSHIFDHSDVMDFDYDDCMKNVEIEKLFQSVVSPSVNSFKVPKRKKFAHSNSLPYACANNNSTSHYSNAHPSSFPTPKNSFPAYQKPKLKSLSLKQKSKDVLAELDNIIYGGSFDKKLYSDFEIPYDIKIWCYNYFKIKK